jgi:hypothetical protein
MSENDNGFPKIRVETSSDSKNSKEFFEQLLYHHAQVFVALDGGG